MGRRKAPYLKPPSRPIFQTLPPELLHVIFSELYIDDVLEIRKTCSLFAAVGLDHLGDEVPLMFHRDKFKALKDIAEHPKLSKQVRSLFYIGDRCKLEDFETWDKGRPDPRPEEKDDFDDDAKIYTERDFRACIREGRKSTMKRYKRTADVSASDRQAGYETFRALCQDIIDIEDGGYDLECLQILFENCPKIREVTISSQMETWRRLNVKRTAFASAMTTPYQDRHWWTSGVHQTLTVVKAAHQAGTRLDSLTLGFVSPLLFDKRDSVGEEEWRALKALVQPLRRLRLFTHLEPPDEEDNQEVDDEDPGIRQMLWRCEQLFSDGYLHEILSSATELRVLKLGMPRWNAYDIDNPEYSRLDWALGETVYPKLYELSISDCEADEDYLVELILRHKSTLRRLYLSNILLYDYEASWREVFARISCQLPQLRRIRLRGAFHAESRIEFMFEYAGMESRRVAPHRDAVENFVLKGGDFPEWDRVNLPAQADYPDESYRRPGLPQDNTKPDDPELDYDSDEFSERI